MTGYNFVIGNKKIIEQNFKEDKEFNFKDYLFRSYNELLLALAKDKEFVANSWNADLNRISSRLDDFYNRLFQDGGIPIYNNRGELESIRFNELSYVNFNNKEALNKLVEANGIKDAEHLELNPIKWNDIMTDINVFDDYLAHGYDKQLQSLQKNYPKYIFKNLMYLRTAPFKNNRDKRILKDFIKSCNDLGFSAKIYEPLAVNEALTNSLDYDIAYELIDEYDIYAMVKTEDILGTEITKAEFKDADRDTLNAIKNAGQAYISTDKGRFYLPIIELNTSMDKLSFSQAAEVLDELDIHIEYELNGKEYEDVSKVEDYCGKISFNDLCKRVEYYIPYEFTPNNDDKQYEDTEVER